MGLGASGGGGRATRALRLLLLLVFALAAVEFIFGSILDASPLKTYLYTPIYNATQPTIRYGDKSWPKRTSSVNPEQKVPIAKFKNVNVTNNTTKVDSSVITSILFNISHKQDVSDNTTEQEIVFSTPLLISKLMGGNKSFVTTEDGVNKREPAMPLCDAMPPDLGLMNVNKSEMELEMVDKKYPEVRIGGRYAPPNCTARHKVAIIVPFRDRQQHLAIFLNHMHPFLMKQQIEYGIFIIEQEGNKEFNRAKLMNVGFVESQRLERGGWQCFIFHDIDLLPLDTRNLYSCPRQPRHMSVAIDHFNFMLPYADIFGGVSALTLEQFVKVNGFSNKYWGWGGEDDDMALRLKKVNYHLSRYKSSIATYVMLDHKKSVPNPKRYQLLSQAIKSFQNDGLSTLEYELVQVVQFHLYTHVLVNLDERS
ncbi:hypothetical protein K1T71_009874 [Dendrolimus kikuchii]|uniref:Uncharacterized protein n=1 Tax=Dendrolimus kikuchii TaxID=765133 RepID=A0ACC1CSX6_9NEOP|nr:hypothetical protein K1T71_009874 [Dendrolimus kikuchii]